MNYYFGQNVPSHERVPSDSRWRNRRSGRVLVALYSSAEAVMTIDDKQRTRVTAVDRFLRFHDRVEEASASSAATNS